jgi:hypothetical protein
MKRLALALLTAAALVTTASTSAFAGYTDRHIGSWEIFEAQDPVTDQPRIIAWLPGINIIFRVHCLRGRPLMTVETKRRYQAGEEVAVVMRIDHLHATIGKWAGQSEMGLAWTRISRVSYAAILKLRKLAIEIFQKDNGSYTYKLNADKTEEALSDIAKACPISSAEDTVPQLFDPSDLPTFSGNKVIMPDKKEE